MNKKKVDAVLALSVTAVLAIASAITAFHPSREMSEKENRKLAKFPEFSMHTLADGTFMKNFETYVSDQFMWRDSSVSLKADAEKASGKKGSKGIHFSKDGYLIARPENPDMENLDKNIDSVISLSDTGIFNVTMAIVPTAFEILKDKLPKYAYDDRIERITNEIKSRTAETDVKVCDTTDILNEHNDEYIYYRTDHHQTALGSFYIYSKLAESLDFEPYKLEDYDREVMTNEFLGTSWSKASLSFQKKDEIERFNLKNADWLDKTLEFPTEDRKLDSIYAEEHLNTKDKYAVYLDGNHGLSVIRSNSGTGRKIAIFKDSYSHSIAPFLSDSFDEVHLIDLRYYSDDIIKYLTDNGIKDVLVLYNAEGFTTDTNVVKIGEFAQNSDYFDPPPFGFLDTTEWVNDDYFNDALFFGDSLTAGYSLYANISPVFVCKQSVNTKSVFTDGFNGRSLMEAMLAHDDVSKYYIMLGINEIGYKPVDMFIDDFRVIIEKIREKNPQALIYIESIMPIEHKVEATNIKKAKIDACNDALEKLAEETSSYYLNINGYLTESDGYLRDGAAADGIHVGAYDYARLEKYLHNHAVVDRKSGKKNQKNEAVKAYAGGGEIDLQAFADEMLSGVPFREKLNPVKENMAAKLVGLGENEVLNGILYTSGGSTSEEFAAFEAETPEKAQEIGEKLRQRVENKKGDFENYKPEEMPNLNDPVVIVDGCLAAMCISDDNGAAETVISHY